MVKAVPLRWGTRKDGTVYTIHRDTKYTIHKRLGEGCRLKVNGKQVFKGTKDECKRWVKIALEPKPKVLSEKTLNKLASLEWFYGGSIDLDIHPKIKVLLSKTGLKRSVLTPSNIRMARVLTRKWLKLKCRPPFPKKIKGLHRDYGKLIKRTPYVEYTPPDRKTKETKEAKPRPFIEPELYDGPAPEERTREGLNRIIVPAGECPLELANAKFSTIYKWAERLRDKFQVRGYFLTIEALHYYAMYMKGFNYERGEKAARRVLAIYQDEHYIESLERQVRFEAYKQAREEGVRVNPKTGDKTEKPVKAKAERDKFGVRVGTMASKINAAMTDEWQSPKKIFKKAGVSRMPHLAWLLKQGHAVKSTKGNYKLKKGKK